MVKEIIEKVVSILGVLIIVVIGGACLLNSNKVEEVKIVTDNTWTNYSDNNEFEVDLSRLIKDYNNSDIYGFLRIDDLSIYTAVTKTGDNEYYLNHDLKDKKKEYGNPFFDYRNKNLTDEVIVIYSKTNNNTMNKLSKLFNRDSFNKELLVNLYIGNESAEYELLAVKMSDSLIQNEDIIKEEYTLYSDYTDTLVEKKINQKVVDNKNKYYVEELEEETEESIPDAITSLNKLLLFDVKYCKEDCNIKEDDKILVIELRNEELNHSNILVIAKKISK